MNCNDIRPKITDYLYGELEPADKKAFETHLQKCRSCEAETLELGNARRIVGRLRSEPAAYPRFTDLPLPGITARPTADAADAEEEPDHAKANESGESTKPSGKPADHPGLTVHPEKPLMPEKSGNTKTAGLTTWLRYAAAAVILMLVTASLVNLEIRHDDNGFQLSMSLFQNPWAHGGFSNQEVLQLLTEREEILIEVFRQQQIEQQEQFIQILDDYTYAVEQQRLDDLELIADELYRLEQQTGFHITQTDRLLYELIQQAGY